MDTVTSVPAPQPRSALRQWLPLLPIFALALGLRIPYLSTIGYRGDLEHFAIWMQLTRDPGLLHFYDSNLRLGVWDRAYPPLATDTFGFLAYLYPSVTKASVDDPNFVVLLKIIPVLCELALVVLSYLWLKDRPTMRWLIPGIIAIYPGLIAVSSWWGQYESPYALFLFLALFAMNRDKPLLAWMLFITGALFKQQAIFVGPLLLVLTFRRYGLSRLIICMVCAGIYFGAACLPFIATSGVQQALSPYLNASDAFPYLTNNAYNFWYTVAYADHGSELSFEDQKYRDAKPALAPITFKEAGLIMFITLLLLILNHAWRYPNDRRELVWGAALYIGLFMLLTQVHERYLYAGSVLAILAVAQDRRVWWIALGTMVTFTYNILEVAIPYMTKGTPNYTTLNPDLLIPPILFLNLICLVGVIYIALRPSRPRVSVGTGVNTLSPSPVSG